MRIPKYEILRQYIIDIARHHEAHEKPIMSEREMSKTFNVTRTSLRRALKELIDEGLLAARQGSGLYITGYTVRNSEARELILPKILVLAGKGRSDFFGRWTTYISSMVMREFSKYPIRLMPGFLVSEKEDLRDEIEMYRPDGILWIRPDKRRSGLIAELQQKYPICQLLSASSGMPLSVTVDFCKAGEIAAKWFYDRGCRNPLYVGASQKEFPSDVRDNFLSGWKRGWKKMMGKFDETKVIPQNEDFKKFFAQKEMKKSDCIFCHSSIFYGFASDAAGTSLERCPIMVDSLLLTFPESSEIIPAAMIEIYPDKMFETAVRKLLTAIKKTQIKYEETLIIPEVKKIKKRDFEQVIKRNRL